MSMKAIEDLGKRLKRIEVEDVDEVSRLVERNWGRLRKMRRKR